MREEINKEAFELTDILTTSCQYPQTLRYQGQTYVCWQEMRDNHDTIWLARTQGKEILDKKCLSGEGESLKPVMCEAGGMLWLVWTECKERRWTLCARYVTADNCSDIIPVAEGEAVFDAAVCEADGVLHIAYAEQGKKQSKIMLCQVTAGAVSEKVQVSEAAEAYRANLCVGGDGILYVAYDVFNGKNYDIRIRAFADDAWTPEAVISTSAEDWAANAKVVYARNGVTVGWDDIGAGSKFSYRSVDVKAEQGKIKAANETELVQGINWYQDIALDANQKGTAVFAYTWGKTSIHVRYRRAGECWSEPVTMSYDDTNAAVNPGIFLGDEDTVHFVWQFASKNGHKPHRNASVVYNRMTLADMDTYMNPDSEKEVDTFCLPIPTPKAFDKNSEAETSAWLAKNGYGDCQAVFGDIHGQSGLSDGMGEIDQFFHYARTKADLDFTALTDHDCYVNWMSRSEWEWVRTTCRLFNLENELASLLAYEWTPNEYRYDFGHKNVYYRGDDGELYRSGDEGGMTPDRLFESVKKFGGMAIPHHPAAVWKLVSAATDWAFHDEEVQRLVEVFSRHAPFEYYGNTSIYTKNNMQTTNCSAQDALARGYHLGFIAGSDSHQMEHGIEGGIMGAYVPELTREHVFDAMYDRFVYATTGARILVSLKINGQNMGSIIKCQAGEQITLDISILGTDELTAVLIRDNEEVQTEKSQGNSCDFTFTETMDDKDHFYYVRVTQKDEHQAWTSPVWAELK